MLKQIYHKIRFLIRANKYYSGYDKDEIRYVIDNLKEGDIAFDIGAHKGAYTHWMFKSVKKKGRIVAIEPQPILHDYLRTTLPIMGYSSVELMDCAVSEKDGSGEITVPGKPGSISQGARIDDQKVVANKHKEDLHKIKVSIRSVDSIIAETGLKPALVKIDVEGHEFSVLKGMEKTLLEIRPKLIIECEARHINDFTVFDVFDYVLSKNYEGYYYQEGKRKKLVDFDLDRDQTMILQNNGRPDLNYIANFIFEPK